MGNPRWFESNLFHIIDTQSKTKWVICKYKKENAKFFRKNFFRNKKRKKIIFFYIKKEFYFFYNILQYFYFDEFFLQLIFLKQIYPTHFLNFMFLNKYLKINITNLKKKILTSTTPGQ